MKHKKLFIFFLMAVLFHPGWAQQDTIGTSIIDLADGFKHRAIFANQQNEQKSLVAHLLTMDESPYNKIKFVSRANFRGDFNYGSIENQCSRNNEKIVAQVAAAFTPDWQVIEGFAMENGHSVGQDSFLGQNSLLPYKGILCIKDGKPFFTHLDLIGSKKIFGDNAKKEKNSLFLQAAPIVNGKLNIDPDLPGSHKRRFFVEIESEKTEFGIITFIHKTTYSNAVFFMHDLKSKGIDILNAIYLDMGSVSEGYVYDKSGKKYLIGNAGTYMTKYTNLLVMYRVGEAR